MQHDDTITIVAASFYSTDWAKLLVESVRKNSCQEHEIILADNTPDAYQALPEMEGVKIMRRGANIGHGEAIDWVIPYASSKYILVLDIDAHIINPGWEDALISKLTGNVRAVGARGGELKPFRPCVSFFERDYFLAHKHSFAPVPVVNEKGGGMTIDTGIFFAFKTLHDGFEIVGLDYIPTHYKNVWGENYELDGTPFFFHHWYGTRFTSGGDVIDGLKKEDMMRSKSNLFAQIPYAIN